MSQVLNKRLLSPLTAVYLAFPVLLFAYGWLKLPYAILTILILCIFIGHAFNDIWKLIHVIRKEDSFRVSFDSIRKSLFWVTLSCLFITSWLFLSGVGGVGFQNSDYQVNNALLKDLVFRPWPLVNTVNGVPTNIVYYVGYYLPAALLGKFLGWNATNIFMFAWTFFGIVLAFGWFYKLSRVSIKKNASKLFFMAFFFCLLGGLDFIGFYILKENTFDITKQVEFWAGIFQYSSNTTLIFWVPQQAIAAWLVVGMLVDCLYEPQNLDYLGISIASIVIWSPFGAVGILPFLLILAPVYLSKKNRGALLNRISLFFNLASVWIGFVLLLYLGSNKFQFPSGWIWKLEDNKWHLIKYLLAFWFLEFAFYAFLVLLFLAFGVLSSKNGSQKVYGQTRFSVVNAVNILKNQFDIIPMQLTLFLTSLLVLFLIPFYKIGFYNEFVMRASIPALFIFWTFVVKVVLDAKIILKHNKKLILLYSFLLLILILGFFPAIAEIARSINRYQIHAPYLSTIPSTTDVLRVGTQNSVFFRYFGK